MKNEFIISPDKLDTKPKLYAILVGISDYASEVRLVNETVRFPKLLGCVNDAKKIKDYLEKDSYYETEIKLLTNENASKSEIVKLFLEHFSKAKEKDVVLFYFSGHGTQEHTDKTLFKSETDGKLEALVCYYDEQTKYDFLLADKELRWLLSQVSSKNPHILTIFDCCHSSGITRNAELIDVAFAEVVEKRVSFVFPKREWNNFIFSNYISSEAIMTRGEFFLLPEASHIQLSACESNEAAFEVSGEGVFTKALLKVLISASGQVSYLMLNNRIRQYLRSVYEQKPMLYIANPNQSIKFCTFLNKQLNNIYSELGEVTYNAKIGWQINLGAIHGINSATKQIELFDPSKNGNTYIARPGIISTDSTQLLITNGELNPEKIYKANLTGLMSKVLAVFIAPRNALPEDQYNLLNEITEHSAGYIELVDDEQAAEFILRYENGNYFVTYPNDGYRPLTAIVKAGTDNWTKKIVELFKHISAWAFIKNLTNSDSNNQLSQNAISIKIASGIPLSPLAPVNIENANVVITYSFQRQRLMSKIKIEITNTSKTDLYCCPVYLTSNFQSFTGYLSPDVYHLEPNESVTLNLDGVEELDIESSGMMKWYNWEKYFDCIKFIVSTEHFESTSLVLNALPEPSGPSERSIQEYGTGKGIVTVLPGKDAIKGWRTYDVKIEFMNPNYNKIGHHELQAMLEDDNTNYFALGLYYDAKIDENIMPVYNLKSEIKVLAEPGEIQQRGFIRDTVIDIANWYARKKKNQHYFNVIARFPDRLRIVSEGDSWFGHPLVLDIIDHISKIYAIYCVAAAGDTLSNYMSNDKKRGQYYLDALDEQNPRYFLISGGGNDILGTRFKDFIVDKISDKLKIEKKPASFLKDSFYEKVKELMEIYKALFGHLEVVKPDLQIIVHGYDYPVKLNNKKNGWLGRYMMEKGISEPEQRKSLIRFIIDEFNKNLQEICEPFKNVHYIDVRNIVRFNENDKVDQWYDEIHPNDDGFQQIAMRFIQKISELEKNEQ